MTIQTSTSPKAGSLKHAAARLGCSVPMVYELIRLGKLRDYHIGRAHRVSDDALTDCIRLLETETAQSRSALPV